MSNIVILDREPDSQLDSQSESQTAVRQPDTSSTTTRTGADAGAGARTREEIELEEEQLGRLMAYAKDGGLPDTPAMRAYNRRLLASGMSIRVLQAAMDETMMAPRPTWHYYAAIMRKLEARGIKLYYQWEQRQARYRAYRDADY